MKSLTQRLSQQAGLTLIELMIAITISLLVLGALTAIFVTSSRARDELTRANAQVENGRYAMQVLSDDLRLAGYYGGADIRDIVAAPASPDDPCFVPSPLPTTTNSPDLETELPVHVLGYIEGANPSGHCGGGSMPSLPGRKANSDVLVIRRVSTCSAGVDANCADLGGNELYFQASFCSNELAAGPKYRLSRNTFDRHPRSATCTGTIAAKRRYMTHIFYIDDANYRSPTLVRVELRNGNFSTITPIAEGIEEMEFEYGIDTNEDGIPDGTYASAPAAADWPNVMAVKVYLLARSTDPSPSHTDVKTYSLGGENFTPGGNFKRHVFQTLVHLDNPAGLRQ